MCTLDTLAGQYYFGRSCLECIFAFQLSSSFILREPFWGYFDFLPAKSLLLMYLNGEPALFWMIHSVGCLKKLCSYELSRLSLPWGVFQRAVRLDNGFAGPKPEISGLNDCQMNLWWLFTPRTICQFRIRKIPNPTPFRSLWLWKGLRGTVVVRKGL